MIRKNLFYLSFSLIIILGSCKKGSNSPETVSPDPPEEKPVCTSCKSISSAAELTNLSLQAGDTVMMKSGDWTNQRLIFKGTGTASAPIVLIAEQAGKVNLKGNSSISIDGQYLVVNGLNFQNGALGASQGNVVDFTSASRNCRLTNTSLVDYNPSDQALDYRWVSVNGRNHRIDHCYLKGKAHQGPTLVIWGANANLSHQIDHNYFGSRPELGNNGGETIRVGTSDYYLAPAQVLIEENIFEHCNGETEIISNKMSNSIIRNNFFFESRGTLCLRHGNSSQVYGNYIIGNNVAEAGGIRIVGESHQVYNNYIQGLATTGQTCAISILDGVPNSAPSGYFQVKNAKIVGNTIVKCKQAFDIGAGKGGNNRTVAPSDCSIANNIILSQNEIVMTYTDQPQNFIFEGNIAYGMGAGQTLVLPQGFLQVDPKLTQLSEFNTYILAAGSPASGAFQGSYPFFQSANAGANAPGDLHKALLKAQGIGPAWKPSGSALTIK